MSTDTTSQAADSSINQETAAVDAKSSQADSPDSTQSIADEASLIEQLQQELTAARESERRALADYQNLVRRQRDERSSLIKFATKELVQSLLEPLSHLEIAAEQLNDQGMNMVIHQFWQRLSENGLEKVDVLGQPFDVNLMEAAQTKGKAEVVVVVHRPAFRLNGEVIQHARVVMGEKSELKKASTKK